MAAVTSSFFRW